MCPPWLRPPDPLGSGAHAASAAFAVSATGKQLFSRPLSRGQCSRMNNIRNFCITAHVDHGKSTLADRFLELTGTVPKNKMHAQYLDRMPLEQERGITIKMQPVRMIYKINHTETLNPKIETLNKSKSINSNFQNNRDLEFRISDLEFSNSEFILNLIDTPGHTDFSYEVSRSFKAVEGAILLVEAAKGVQAQTVSNYNLARKNGLKIIPVLN